MPAPPLSCRDTPAVIGREIQAQKKAPVVFSLLLRLSSRAPPGARSERA